MAKHVCAPELGTPCVWFIQHWREQQGGERGGGGIGHIHHEVILYSRITSQAHLEHGS